MSGPAWGLWAPGVLLLPPTWTFCLLCLTAQQGMGWAGLAWSWQKRQGVATMRRCQLVLTRLQVSGVSGRTKLAKAAAASGAALHGAGASSNM